MRYLYGIPSTPSYTGGGFLKVLRSECIPSLRRRFGLRFLNENYLYWLTESDYLEIKELMKSKHVYMYEAFQMKQKHETRL